MEKKNNWRDILPLEDTAHKTNSVLARLDAKLTQINENVSSLSTTPLDVDINLTLPEAPQDNKGWLDNVLRWSTQNSLFSPTSCTTLENWINLTTLAYNPTTANKNAFKSAFGVDLGFTTESGVNYIIITMSNSNRTFMEVMNILDPSNFLFGKNRRTKYVSSTTCQYGYQIGNTSNYGFSYVDFGRFIRTIWYWQRPCNQLDNMHKNNVAPESSLARNYKDFQANQHNFYYARMHSREYFKQYFFVLRERVKAQSATYTWNDLDDATKDELYQWYVNLITSPYNAPSPIFCLDEFKTHLSALFDLAESLFDAPAVNLAEHPQARFRDIFSFMAISLLME